MNVFCFVLFFSGERIRHFMQVVHIGGNLHDMSGRSVGGVGGVFLCVTCCKKKK